MVTTTQALSRSGGQVWRPCPSMVVRATTVAAVVAV
jgi:hypothetical protein